MKPLLLITNDDGIHSPGLLAVAEAVCDLGELLISAPITQQTGMGRAFPRMANTGIIEKIPLQVNGQKLLGYGVHGSPAFAVAHGVLELANRKPDLCISGINYGENMGMVLTCSGTLGAIFEADSHGIPGIAVSLQAEISIQRSKEYPSMDWEPAKKITRKWVTQALEQGMPSNAEMLNINIPLGSVRPEEYRITRQSRQNYFEFIKPEQRNLGEPFALQTRIHIYEETLEKDSDIYAFYKDKITSVTPLTWGMSVK